MMVDVDRRVQLAEALIKSVGAVAARIRIELSELTASEPTQTYHTYQKLTQTYPEYSQTWVFGADTVASLRAWRGGEQLWHNLSMLVIPRAGVILDELPPYARVLPVQTAEVSSTLVRARQQSGQKFDTLVPPEVAAVLQSVG